MTKEKLWTAVGIGISVGLAVTWAPIFLDVLKVLIK